MIRRGTELNFTVNGQAGQWPRSVADVRSAVIDGLTPFFDVPDVPIVTPSFLSDPLDYFINWPYTAKVRAIVKADYAEIRDVDSIVANAFYNAAGELPTVTEDSLEKGQGNPDSTKGISLTTALALVAVGLVAVAVMKVA